MLVFIGTTATGLVFCKVVCPVRRALQVFSMSFPTLICLLIVLNLVLLMRSNLF